MKFHYATIFKRELRELPQFIRNRFYKQAGFLLRDIRHPSLHAKKYSEKYNVWQARVDKNYRFYFLIKNNTYILLHIKKHPK